MKKSFKAKSLSGKVLYEKISNQFDEITCYVSTYYVKDL